MIATNESISSDPDAQMMAQIGNGDLQLFDRLVRQHEASVRCFIGQMQGDQREADDLAQEVFLRVFVARHSYQPTAKFTTWLYAITRNVVRNSHRRIARKREINLVFSNEPSLMQLAGISCTEPVDVAIARESDQAVIGAINQLEKGSGKRFGSSILGASRTVLQRSNLMSVKRR